MGGFEIGTNFVYAITGTGDKLKFSPAFYKRRQSPEAEPLARFGREPNSSCASKILHLALPDAISAQSPEPAANPIDAVTVLGEVWGETLEGAALQTSCRLLVKGGRKL